MRFSWLFCLMAAVCPPIHAQQTMVFSAVQDTLISDINQVIIREAYNRLGIKVVIKAAPAARALQQSNSGKYDGELFRIANIHKKYTNLMMIPVVSYEVEIRVYSKLKEFRVAGWDSLKPYKVGIERGVVFSDIATKGMDRQVVNTVQQLFKILYMKRVDIVVTDVWSALGALHALQQEGISTKEIRALSPKVMVIQLHHYLHKKHKALIPKVSQAIQSSIQAGVVKKAESNIFSQYSLGKTAP